MKKKIYFDNLDGLRFLCFLSVFFFHSFHTEYDYIKSDSIYQFFRKTVFGNGNIGVNFFFVLSGYLITYLLIEEKKLNGQIDPLRFWLRRILRIWPLFYFCVFFGFVIFPFLKSTMGQTPNETAHLLNYLTFTNNFDLIKNGLPDASILGVLWSVAIEEQFYLVWPIIVFIFPLSRLWIPFGIIILTSLVFRGLNDTAIMHECHTLSCIGDMAVGAAAAWAVNSFDFFKKQIEAMSKYVIVGLYAVFLLIFLLRDEFLFSTYALRIFERLILGIVIAFIILEQCFAKNSIFKMSNFKRISSLGIITYGLYCMHFIGILVAITITKKLSMNTALWQVLILETALALSISIIISKISYKYFEKPFLNIKDRFSYITK